MSNDQESDGLDSFNLDQIGMKTGAFGGARVLTFDTDHFKTREGDTIGPEHEMTALGLKKVVQKFVGGKLVSTEVVPDGEKMPDIAALNEAAPREEWSVSPFNGTPTGPYVGVLVLKMIDKSMNRFAFVTSSVGGSIAIGDLSDKTKIARRFNGPGVVPVVSCTTTNFKIKRLNIVRKRPDFRVLRWIQLPGDGGNTIPAPKPTPSLAAPTIAPVSPTPLRETPKPQQSAAPSPPVSSAPTTIMTLGKPITSLGTPVEPPTLKQEMNDDLPFSADAES